MKVINKSKLELIRAGDLWAWVDGYCVGYAAVGVLTGGAALAVPFVGQASAVGCGARAVYLGFKWWQSQ